MVAIFAYFQNRLISRILVVFSSRFLHETIVMCQQSRFSPVSGIFNFRAKLTVQQRLQPLYSGRLCIFSKSSHLKNISCFFKRFSHETTGMSYESPFLQVLSILKFGAKLTFQQGLQPLYNGDICIFSKSSHFSNSSCFFKPLLHKTTAMSQQSRFSHVLAFLIFEPN